MGRPGPKTARPRARSAHAVFPPVLGEIFGFLRSALRHGSGSTGRGIGAFFAFWFVSACLTVPAIGGMLCDEATRDEVLPMLFLTSDAWRPQEDTTGSCCHGGCFHCNWARQQRHVEE